MTVPKKQRKSTRRSTSRLSGLPTVQGGITRFAVDRLRRAGIKLQPLLSGVGLTVDQVDEPERRLSASKQIAFLEAAAEALNDHLLGFRLAEQFDLRELGLLYYVMATADTLGDALKRASRYSRITNEAVILEYREGREPVLRLAYAGIPRHADRQQMEFCMIAIVRLSRALSARRFFPTRVSLVHVRPKGNAKFAGWLGKDIEFGGDTDEIGFPPGSSEWPLAAADPRLSRILLKTAEETLGGRKRNRGAFRIAVENAICPLLPHGEAKADVVAKNLGTSERTLARRLAEEGATFNDILQQLKASLAVRYLKDEAMPISEIAWLLGFEEASSFTHACRRWTGKSPREFRLSS